ncbi:MAG: type II toxin-antitoxin system RelE/ParE family toxin, partial [Prevotella sp.]|nr:type II toxin-antitoxin system RelE/ParE family toxin [Prevotella sp.]
MPSYDLTLAVEVDLRDIWRYTLETWEPEQADKYLHQFGDCLDVIASRRAPSKSLPQLPDEDCIHRCHHHSIFWIVIDRPIIIAVLHEKMDVPQRNKDRLYRPSRIPVDGL